MLELELLTNGLGLGVRSLLWLFESALWAVHTPSTVYKFLVMNMARFCAEEIRGSGLRFVRLVRLVLS